VVEHNVEKALRARNLRTLAILAGLFLLPLAAAFWMYYGTQWRPARTINQGELISPVRPLAEDRFKRKWTLVYVGDGQCDADCRKALFIMRQTRLSLANDMNRVERAFLVTGNCCAKDVASAYPGLIILDTPRPDVLAAFPGADRPHSLFIVDPLGNLMMRFDLRQDPKGLLQDLKKLLSLSHIG
jgi:hypothetical protein